MDAIWQILVEFLFRLTFGIAVSMGITPSRLVTSGFFRIHLWVLMGICTFAVPAIYTTRHLASAETSSLWWWQLGMAVGAAVVSYVGAVIWMYEAARPGKAAIWIVAGIALAGMLLPLAESAGGITILGTLDRISGSLVLGSITTAMLLGHWYLNTPSMKLAPLQRLVLFMAVAIVIRLLLAGVCAGLEVNRLSLTGNLSLSWLVFLSLRWLAGLIGTLGLAWMTWLTLKIPNTQSATGILYASMILAFIGELTAQLMSVRGGYPL
ncbi:MAG: hypothetical protein K8R36_03440 [Planctomycetales bacterium]|nr:hypothetical protein [Planctomycetales bacterium]